MRRLRTAAAMAGALTALGAVALTTSAARTPAATPRPPAADGFDRSRFTAPTTIDNRWFPLTPGTQFILAGHANRGDGVRRHRVVFTVTDLTKVIDGVRTLVMWDRDYNAGRLEEGELTFHAQDDSGTVWNFGEYPEQFEHGRLAGAPDTWIAGAAGARAGILMPGAPRVGTASYLQGWAPTIDFADRARIYRSGQRTCVPVACFRDVLVTDEWNPSEPGAHQRKYYARGVGTVRVGSAGRDKEAEGLVLLRVRRLSPGALVTVRREVRRIDHRAYRVRGGLYRHTPPVEPLPEE